MKSFSQLLLLAGEKKISKKDYFIGEQKSISYGEMSQRVNKIYELLESNGIQQGDRVLVSLGNDYDMVCVVLGILAYGATAVLIEPDAKERRAGVIISSAQIHGWIVDKNKDSLWHLPEAKLGLALEEAQVKRGALVSKLLNKKKETDQRHTLDSILQPFDRTSDVRVVPEDSDALIIYTSGSTADPKGVVLSHGNLLAHLATLSRQYQFTSDSVISNILPLYHVDGLIQGPLLALYNKITLSRPFTFEVQKIEDLLISFYKYKVSHFFAVPTMLSLIDKFGVDSRDSFETDHFKFVISVAGYLEETLWESFMSNFQVKVVNVFGLTETVAGGFFCGPSNETWRLGSIGKPQDSEVKIVNEQGISLAQGEVGELAIKGDHVMKAYLKPLGNPDKDGWFYTGDLAYCDKDGFYYIKGRLKNVIIRGGINIYPEEVIETLHRNPEIDEAFVYGETDETWGEKIIAVLKVSSSTKGDDQAMIQYCRKHLEQTSVPDKIYFLDELPKGLSGKVMLDHVKTQVKSISDRNIDNNSAASVQNTVLNIASECFNSTLTKAQLKSPSHAIQGWNSLEHLQFATMIEESFQIQLSTKDIMNITSISAAVDIVTRNIEEA